MNTAAQTGFFAQPPLETRALELSRLLCAGLDAEFARQFKSSVQGMDERESEQLVLLINKQLSMPSMRREVRLVISQSLNARKTVTVMDSSRLFGSSWSIPRQTFAY